MRADIHWHHVPRLFVEAVLGGQCPIGGSLKADDGRTTLELKTGFRYRLGLDAPHTDVAYAVNHMAEAGLDLVALSLTPPLMHHGADPAVAQQVSETVNDGLAQVVAENPGRFVALGNVPMQEAGLAVAELRRVVKVLGFPGVAIGTHVNGRNLGEDEYRPFWQAVADLNAVVLLHPVPPSLGSKDRLARHGLANFVGLPIDTAAALASLIFDGVYEDCGPLKTCFSHGGGAFPYLLGRWEHGYHARLAAKGPKIANPMHYLGSVYADSLTHSDAALRFLVEVLGADHVCLGSDFPADMGEPEPCRAMERAILDEATREQVGWMTAAHLLALEPTR